MRKAFIWKGSGIALMILSLAIPSVHGQRPDSIPSEQIAVVGRPSDSSVTLRWAPLTYKIWRDGNAFGYTVERYVIARNGKLLQPPEKSILQHSIKPWPEAQWEALVPGDRYAPIAAQALFGDRFEVDLQQGDVFTVINKAQENEQRFSFALFCADMSPRVAEACGLLFRDKDTRKNDKYLYRVIVSSADSVRGSIFISPDDSYQLPKPQNLTAEFKDHYVSLKWDRTQISTYTAYVVERSQDGKAFSKISNAPLVTVSPLEQTDTRYEYATDSLKDLSGVYHYRVKGITPFGEESPPSDVVSGKAIPSVEQVPFIKTAENIDNASILIRWEFPETSNRAIRGFEIERASSPGENYLSLNRDLIHPGTRQFEDKIPQQVNYYRVKAHGLDGEYYPSHTFFAQLVDSIPPSRPSGLEAKVDDEGRIDLSWNANTDPDLYGYRIYRTYHQSEEPAQITDAPLSMSSLTDRVDLNTLNEHIFYQVMAIDNNQNHSLLSEPLEVHLPDRVKPQPPVMLPISGNEEGITLSWTPGASEDIVHYKVYRRVPGEPAWAEIKVIDAGPDSVYTYVDGSARRGKLNHYTILSVDEAGLESAPAHPVSAMHTGTRLRAAITWKKPKISRDENQIILSWTYDHSGVGFFKIFRSVDGLPPVLFATVKGNLSEHTDTMIPGKTYSYRIMALFGTGEKSFLSEELKYEY